jgi:hypothetical protein
MKTKICLKLVRIRCNRPSNRQDSGIVCYGCGIRGHISRDCWGGNNNRQFNRPENPRFSGDNRRNPSQFNQQWIPNGSQSSRDRSRNQRRFDQNNNSYGRNFNRERGQSNERVSQDYRSNPPRNARQ